MTSRSVFAVEMGGVLGALAMEWVLFRSELERRAGREAGDGTSTPRRQPKQVPLAQYTVVLAREPELVE